MGFKVSAENPFGGPHTWEVAMANIRIFSHYSGDKVFLAVQMLKRHHRLIVRRNDDDYLMLVRPAPHVAGNIQFLIPDPRWPESEDGQPTWLNPEDATDLDIRMATEQEAQALADDLVDALYP